ncbi:MAG TPA: secretin N-terminal domain-containing protein, partial [bacterium]|nr:secretin N-terminal domain-containing protein [bacterium]
MNVPLKSLAVATLVVISAVGRPAHRLAAQESPPVPEPARKSTPASAVAVPAPTAVPTPPGPESLDAALSQRHSFRFVNEDIRVVLRGLARAYEFNITIAPEVTGKVTADFQNVKIRDVIDNILKDYGYGYRESGDILRITTLEKLKIEDENEAIRKEAQAKRLEAEKKQAEAELAKEPVIIKVFRLKYIDATNVQAAIEPLLSVAGVNQPAGTAVVLETKQFTGFAFENVTTYSAARSTEETRDFVRSNTLIVKDKESVVAEIGRVIEQLDRKPYQIMIDAKLIEVPINQDFRLGLDWSGALDQLKIDVTGASVGLSKSYEKTRTSTGSVTRSSGNEWENTNLSSREISDEASAEHSLINDSGINYTASNSTGPYQINSNRQESVVSHSDTALSSSADSTTYFDNYINSIVDQVESIAKAGNTASMVLSAADFSVLISALESDSDITILSNPRIIVHENYAANIFVGQRYPILSTEFDAAGGASAGAVGGTKVEEWREIGIALKVIPQLRKT